MARGSKAFTLIEMMITVAILAILATIAMPKFADIINRSREGATKGSLGALRSILSIYYGDMEGVYPSSLLAVTIGRKYVGEIPKAKIPSYHPDLSTVSEGAGIIAVDEAGGWHFNVNPTDPYYGRILVNCTHTDLKGTVWSTY